MTTFVKNYFDGKDGDALLRTVTPDWSDEAADRHIQMLGVPEYVSSIMEIGCGPGRLLARLAKRDSVKRCIGFDASGAMVEQAKTTAPDKKVTVCRVAGDGSLPLIEPVQFAFAWLVFQHIPSGRCVRRYIRAALENLEPGGVFKCQLLARDDRKDQPLWTYHDPDLLLVYMMKIGYHNCTETRLGDKWIMLEGEAL